MRGRTRERSAWFSLLFPRLQISAGQLCGQHAKPCLVLSLSAMHPGPPRPLLWYGDNVVSQGLPASRFAVRRYNATLKLSMSPCIRLAPVPSTPVLQTGLASWKDMPGYNELIPADRQIRTWCCTGMEWGPSQGDQLVSSSQSTHKSGLSC